MQSWLAIFDWRLIALTVVLPVIVSVLANLATPWIKDTLAKLNSSRRRALGQEVLHKWQKLHTSLEQPERRLGRLITAGTLVICSGIFVALTLLLIVANIVPPQFGPPMVGFATGVTSTCAVEMWKRHDECVDPHHSLARLRRRGLRLGLSEDQFPD